jgi:hypothetical protein
MTLDQSFGRKQIPQRIANMPLAWKGAEDGERVLVLGGHMSVEEDDELGEERRKRKNTRGRARRVGQRREVPLRRAKVEDDGQVVGGRHESRDSSGASRRN